MSENDPKKQDVANPLAASSTTSRVEELARRIEASATAPVVRPMVPPARRQTDFGPPAPAAHDNGGQSGDSSPGGLVEYWHMLRRGKWWIVFAAVVGGIGGLLFTLPQTPVYRAGATIEVLDMGSGSIGAKDAPIEADVAAANLQTQVEILQSGTLQDRVIHKLANSEKQIEQPVDRMAKWRKVLRLPQKPVQSREDILIGTSGGLNVQASSSSRIIHVDCESSNPNVAADYVNALAEEFINERMESHWQATQRTSEYLTRQLEELKAKLVASQDELQRYASSVGLQFIGEQGNQNVADQKLGQLQTELTSAAADRIAKQSRYDLAQNAPLETLPEVLSDDSMKMDRQKLADESRLLETDLRTYKPGTVRITDRQNRIASIKDEMNKTRANILAKIKNDLVAAQTRENLLMNEVNLQQVTVSDQSAKAVHYNILKNEVDTNRQVWESLLQHVKEANITAAMRSSNFRVVDPAVPPGTPIRPTLRSGVMSGMVLGLFAGIGIVFLKESLDHSVTLPRETSFYLSAPELAVVPSTAPGGHRWALLRRKNEQRLLAGRDRMVERSAYSQSDSMVAEAFRVALTSLLFANRQSPPPRAITISSPGPAEGKTTVACNLAMSYAEINWRVLLIDGDMRRPRLHGIFGLPNDAGLATLLTRTESTRAEDLLDAAQTTSVPNLSVLARGKMRNTAVNLLYSPRFAEVVALAREQYDIVVIDTPPMLHLPDARAIAHLTDGVVFVVRSGKTLRDTVITARERFRQDGVPILGSILNDWNPKQVGYYGHDNYEDYRMSYYGKGPSDSELN